MLVMKGRTVESVKIVAVSLKYISIKQSKIPLQLCAK